MMNEWIRAFFAHLCHQLPERTLGAGTAFLCARCTGFYAGALLATLSRQVFGRGSRGGASALAAALVLVALGGLDAIAPDLLFPSTNLSRLVTGLAAGIGLALAANDVLTDTLSLHGEIPARPAPHAAAIVLGAVLVVAAAWSGDPLLISSLSIVSAAGFVVNTWLVNAVVVARVTAREPKRATPARLRLIALVLVAAEMLVLLLTPFRRG